MLQTLIRSNNMKRFYFLLLLLVVSTPGHTEVIKTTNESELTFIQTGGNTAIETYNVKTETKFHTQDYILSLGGHYFLSLYETKNSDDETIKVESARAWDVSTKLEKEMSKRLNFFAGLQIESDKFSGFQQRDNYDIGGKYSFIKTDKKTFSTELGYRYSVEHEYNELQSNGNITTSNKARIHTEFEKQLNETLSYKLWIEYLANFTEPDDYMINLEPSMMVNLTNTFSFKIAYIGNYDNQPAAEKEKLNFKYTMSLLANF